jgi:hypothetical protein
MVSEVRIVKELWAHFSQVRILKDLCWFGVWENYGRASWNRSNGELS